MSEAVLPPLTLKQFFDIIWDTEDDDLLFKDELIVWFNALVANKPVKSSAYAVCHEGAPNAPRNTEEN